MMIISVIIIVDCCIVEELLALNHLITVCLVYCVTNNI